MSILYTEVGGQTLVGIIDGVNRDYTTTHDYESDSVNMFLNGLLLVRSWPDGFIVIPPRTVRMNLPPRDGDSLHAEYRANVVISGGGADGGCPSPPMLSELIPMLSAHENIPGLAADTLRPNMASNTPGDTSPVTKILRPMIISGTEGE